MVYHRILNIVPCAIQEDLVSSYLRAHISNDDNIPYTVTQVGHLRIILGYSPCPSTPSDQSSSLSGSPSPSIFISLHHFLPPRPLSPPKEVPWILSTLTSAMPLAAHGMIFQNVKSPHDKLLNKSFSNKVQNVWT